MLAPNLWISKTGNTEMDLLFTDTLKKGVAQKTSQYLV
jgi:hypothetical protein